jgi:cobalt-zinc-cadmium efflux system outer membrane protein
LPTAGLATAAVVSLVAGGCASPPAAPDTSREISDATGIEAAIEFRWTGAPLDDERGLDSGTLLRRETAIGDALKSDPRLQSALARVRIALAESERARTWPNPILSIVFRFPEGGGAPLVEAGFAAELLALLRRPSRVRAADHRLSGASADAVTTALDSVAEVEEAYSAVQALDAVVPLLEARSALVMRLVDLSRARLDAGEESRPNVTAIEARRLSVEIEIAEKKRHRIDARLRLLRLLGRPSGEAEFSLEPWSAPEIADWGDAEWIRRGLERRPEIRARRMEIRALEEEAALTGTSWLTGATLGIDAERDGDWSAGPAAAVPIPLFDAGGPERARLEAARAELIHEITLVERRIVEDVRRAHESLRALFVGLRRVRDELIPLQEQRRSEMERLFRAGQTDATPLLLAEEALQAARVQRVELELETSIAHTRLERAVGGNGALRENSEKP